MLHIAFSKPLDLDKIRQDAAADRAPGHVMLDLAQRIPTTFHLPTPELSPTAADKLRAKIFPTAHLWAHARNILRQVPPTDTIYATGEDIGIPLATLARRMKSPPRICMFVHNLNRPRAKAAILLFKPLPTIHKFFTNADDQLGFLQVFHHLPKDRTILLPEQIDTTFFRPALSPQSSVLSAPLIVSVGLEQRDYKTLAAATHDLPVQVKISAYSKDARTLRESLPDPLPQNMTRQFYDWSALRELYHQATLIVVPLFENPYCAGLTAYLEAAACRKPVIITQTSGLNPILAFEAQVENACLTVPPQNPTALREAIHLLLADPARAAQLATKAHAVLHYCHTPAHFIDALLPHLADGGT